MRSNLPANRELKRGRGVGVAAGHRVDTNEGSVRCRHLGHQLGAAADAPLQGDPMLLHRAIAAVTLLNVLWFPGRRWLLAHIIECIYVVYITRGYRRDVIPYTRHSSSVLASTLHARQTAAPRPCTLFESLPLSTPFGSRHFEIKRQMCTPCPSGSPPAPRCTVHFPPPR